MAIPLVETKLYVPPLRQQLVSRPRLLERLKTGLQLKLMLIAAPAGYGKTTLVSEGVRSSQMPVGWLTLDEDDNDLTRFWLYVISAMQTVQADIGKSALGLLQSPQPPPIESILTNIINEISKVNEEFALVLDDFHMIEVNVIALDCYSHAFSVLIKFIKRNVYPVHAGSGTQARCKFRKGRFMGFQDI